MIAIISEDFDLSAKLGLELEKYGKVAIFTNIGELIERLIERMKEDGLCPEAIFWKKEFKTFPPIEAGISYETAYELGWIRRRFPDVKLIFAGVYNHVPCGYIADALKAYFLGLPIKEEQLKNLFTKLFPGRFGAAIAGG